MKNQSAPVPKTSTEATRQAAIESIGEFHGLINSGMSVQRATSFVLNHSVLSEVRAYIFGYLRTH
jgi:hypothetical protein